MAQVASQLSTEQLEVLKARTLEKEYAKKKQREKYRSRAADH